MSAQPMRVRQSRGVALISVLLTVAILLAVASRLMTGHNLVINQNQNAFEQNQALQYALGAETLARQALHEDFTTAGPGKDHVNEIWAQQIMPLELDEGGFLEAQVRDLNGCFNVNAVVGANAPKALERMKLLLNNLGLQPQIADAWKDWIDGDAEITGFGAEDSEYLIAEIPHRTPNSIVTDLSEFALLQNITRDQLSVLLPAICMLPDPDSKLNVNTADIHALASLDKSITASIAEGAVAEVREYGAVTEFTGEFNEFTPLASELSVTSEYFQIHATAQVGSSSVSLLSMLHRDASTGEVTVLQRDFGKLFRSSLVVSTPGT